jgi:hypothetical protein
MKATIIIAGALNAANAAMSPSADARLYPGAVEETPITTFDRYETAFLFRPLSPA